MTVPRHDPIKRVAAFTNSQRMSSSVESRVRLALPRSRRKLQAAWLERPASRACGLEVLSLCGRAGPMTTEPALVYAEPSGVIRSWNAGAEALFGHPAADAIGQTLDLIVPPEFRERHWTGFRAAMAAGDGKIDRAAANIPALHRDGTVMRVAVRLLVVQDARDRAAGAMAVFVTDDETAPPLDRKSVV